MTVYIKGLQMADPPVTCTYIAYMSGHCDTLDMIFDDSEGTIKGMELVKGDTVQALEGNVDTGDMYISGIDYNGSQVAIRALSLPLSAFKTGNQHWENATFTAIIRDVLKETGLKVEFIDRPDFMYKEMTRVEQAPLAFLSDRLSLESYGIRVNNNTAYVFDEKAAESKEYLLQMDEESFDSSPVYSTDDARLVSEIENSYNMPNGTPIKTTVKSGIEGRILRLSMAVNTVGESLRFSNGMMRAANCTEYLAEGDVENLDRQPGEVVYLADAPKGHTGENIIYRIKNDLSGNKQTLYMRRPITGDY